MKDFILQKIFVLIFSALSVGSNLVPNIAPTPSSPSEYRKITKVIDGDTIETDHFERIRYIGMNTPEIANKDKPDQCFALAAKQKNEELVLNKTVRLEKDVSETDKYKRLLRFVYVTRPNSNEIMVNQYLLQEGYAQLMSIPPDIAKADQFKKLQQEARIAQKGLWKECKK